MSTRPEILVVDDEPRIRRFLRTNLDLAGYVTIEAEDGPSALHLFEQHALQDGMDAAGTRFHDPAEHRIVMRR